MKFTSACVLALACIATATPTGPQSLEKKWSEDCTMYLDWQTCWNVCGVTHYCSGSGASRMICCEAFDEGCRCLW
ncbi:hypothetical protein GGS26DRAFT_442529 [Hypomontagnella submonticulosa]|nr:hypothetical protein GGS26DRAFT_442529 [Hypomontagnella submonticulosa]